MNFLKPTLSITFALCTLAGASVLDAARADDSANPYLPKPAASSETSDHGQGTYCRIGNMIPGWTCDQELSTGGGYGTGTPDPSSKDKQAYGATHQPKPPKPPCDKGGETASTGESRHGSFRQS